ncbi:hypothetical protein CYMTET_6213, partial [Cymbomonas tetramitiformis]
NLVGCVELVMGDHVEKVFFPVLPSCRWVQQNKDFKSQFAADLLGVPRKSTQGKLKEFMNISEVTAFNVTRLAMMQDTAGTRWLLRFDKLLARAPLWLALILCGLLSQNDAAKLMDNSAVEQNVSHWTIPFIRVLGVCHVGVTLLATWHYLQVEARLKVFKLAQRSVKEEFTTEELNPTQQQVSKLLQVIHKELKDDEMKSNNLTLLMHDARMHWLLASLCISLFSLFVSMIAYPCILLLHALQDSAALTIIAALRNSGSRIASTLVLGVLVIMTFAFASFMLFYDDMRSAYTSSTCAFANDQDECEENPEDLTLTLVVLAHVQSALLSMGMESLVDPSGADCFSMWRVTPMDFSDHSQAHFRNFMTILFDLVWQLILLNIITGLIIDAFLSVRFEEQEKENDSKQNCFICSCDRNMLDNVEKYSFEEHVEKDHNPWDYVCYLVYLNSKDPLELNGIESHVHRHLTDDERSNERGIAHTACAEPMPRVLEAETPSCEVFSRFPMAVFLAGVRTLTRERFDDNVAKHVIRKRFREKHDRFSGTESNAQLGDVRAVIEILTAKLMLANGLCPSVGVPGDEKPDRDDILGRLRAKLEKIEHFIKTQKLGVAPAVLPKRNRKGLDGFRVGVGPDPRVRFNPGAKKPVDECTTEEPHTLALCQVFQAAADGGTAAFAAAVEQHGAPAVVSAGAASGSVDISAYGFTTVASEASGDDEMDIQEELRDLRHQIVMQEQTSFVGLEGKFRAPPIEDLF